MHTFHKLQAINYQKNCSTFPLTQHRILLLYTNALTVNNNLNHPYLFLPLFRSYFLLEEVHHLPGRDVVSLLYIIFKQNYYLPLQSKLTQSQLFHYHRWILFSVHVLAFCPFTSRSRTNQPSQPPPSSPSLLKDGYNKFSLNVFLLPLLLGIEHINIWFRIYYASRDFYNTLLGSMLVRWFVVG